MFFCRRLKLFTDNYLGDNFTAEMQRRRNTSFLKRHLLISAVTLVFVAANLQLHNDMLYKRARQGTITRVNVVCIKKNQLGIEKIMNDVGVLPIHY
jgi:hypothetical protein